MLINVETSSKNYNVVIGEHALLQLNNHLQSSDYTKLLVITDETVATYHLNELISNLPTTIDHDVFQVPSGEMAKQFQVYEAALSFALDHGLDRKSCIIAFGGGAVGDLAGFVAATFMRGIPFIQVPTTILAHDSAVGGKTGINHAKGKNLIGAFYQPEGVYYYTKFLKTLPLSEIRSGFAEAVKHALIADPALLNYLIENIHDLSNIKEDHLNYILKRGIEIKSEVVSKDERESGVRAILNFGHTLGHAIEAVAGYGKVTHGEAVMTGMLYALWLSKECVGFTGDIVAFETWIKQLGYKLEISKSFNFDHALKIMKSDKKSIGDQLRFVLLKEYGSPVIHNVSEEELQIAYRRFLSTTNLIHRD